MQKSRPARVPISPVSRRVLFLAALVPAGFASAIGACGFEGAGNYTSNDEAGAADVLESSTIPRDGGEGGFLPEDGGSSILLDAAGALPDDPPVDAGPDGACPPETFRCASSDTCLAKCGACPGARFRCPTTSTCVDTCGSCKDRGFECAACTSDGVTASKFICEPSAATCYVDGSRHCDCNFYGCYSAQQVCLYVDFFTGYECRTCGEPGTGNRTCVGGNLKCSNGAKSECK